MRSSPRGHVGWPCGPIVCRPLEGHCLLQTGIGFQRVVLFLPMPHSLSSQAQTAVLVAAALSDLGTWRCLSGRVRWWPRSSVWHVGPPPGTGQHRVDTLPNLGLGSLQTGGCGNGLPLQISRQ